MNIKTLPLITFLGLPIQAMADHVGLQIDGGAGSAITTMGGQTLAKNQHVLSLAYQYLDLDELSDDTLLGSEEELHSVKDFSQASIGYSFGITDRLTLSAVLPYVSRDGFREAEHGHDEEFGESEHEDEAEEEHHDGDESEEEIASSDLSGWGDLSLLGRYSLTGDNTKHQYALLAGVKIPTGSTSEKLGDGERAEVEHQPGSSSWDPLLGLAYSNQLNSQWSFSSNVLYQLTSEGKRDTEIGDSLLYNAAFILDPADHSHHGGAPTDHVDQNWQYVVELNGEWRGETEVDDVEDANTGGNVIFASAGLRWSYGLWGIHLSVATPILEDLNGVQSEPDWRMSTGISYSF